MQTNYQKTCLKVLCNLTNRQQQIMARRFGLVSEKPETLQKIGDDFGITRERVRQIERESLGQLRKSQVQDNELTQSFLEIKKCLSQKGGFFKEDILLQELGKANEQNHIYFLLTLGDSFYRFSETDSFFAFWSIRSDIHQQVNQLINSFVKKLSQVKKPLDSKEFLNCDAKVQPKFCLSTLDVSKKIAKGPFGQFGLKQWAEIRPRGVKDAAFLALKQSQKPMHFREIAQKATSLLSSFLNNRQVLPQTVHNELIRDPRFVLVGRGIYGLEEWGYLPGTVKDVIVFVLKQAGKPLDKDKIAKKVLDQRLVKENTVFLNLNNRAVFIRDNTGKYSLV